MAAGAHAEADEARGEKTYDLQAMAQRGEVLNLFFGGCGDARHMFETLKDFATDSDTGISTIHLWLKWFSLGGKLSPIWGVWFQFFRGFMNSLRGLIKT